MPTLVADAETAQVEKFGRKVYPRLRAAEEFLDWLQPKKYADLINGTVAMHSPVSFRHATLLNFVQGLLMLYVEEKNLGRVDRENIAVRLDARNVFMPDLSFFTNEQITQLLPNHAPMAPALVVEALSPRTARRDTGPKFVAYELHGVLEYWILDPYTQSHRFYAREGALLVEFAHGQERIDSRVLPGFFMERAWLDPVNPPKIEACLREIRGQQT